MNTVTLELEEPLVTLLSQSNQAVTQAAKEMIVLELYRRGSIPDGKAAELMGMSRAEFIQHTSRLGIPYLRATDDEQEDEAFRSTEFPADDQSQTIDEPSTSIPGRARLEALKRQLFTPEGKAERIAKALAALNQEVFIPLTLDELKRIVEDPDLEDQF